MKHCIHKGAREIGGTCVLALELERWMRRKLQGTASVHRAVEILRRIKVGELEVGGKITRIATKPTAEQKQLLRALGVWPIPASFKGEAKNVVQKTKA